MEIVARSASETRPRGIRTPPQPPPSRDLPANDELLHFFNESTDLLCITDSHGRFKLLNPAWQRITGWSIKELRARSFLDLVHPDDRPVTPAEMNGSTTGRTATAITFENRYRCKDDSWKWLQWTATPLAGRQKISIIARDVTRQRILEGEILTTLDRERERVGRELHDGLCQDLAAIAAFSASLARTLAPASAAESTAAREIGTLLGQSVRHAHDLARGYIPLHLKGVGLVAALADFCLNTEALFKITCRFHCEPRRPMLATKRRSHLYRIVQEAVSNAIIHGKARQIDVSLGFHNGQGTLAILDDGCGIGDSHERQAGIGLHTMTYRARLIGASLEVKRRAPHGTVVTCVFPLPPATPKP